VVPAPPPREIRPARPIPPWPDMGIEAPELGPDAVLDRLRAAGARDLDVGEVFRLEEP
jgi:hypothetical protein